jgi:PIN domain nuclease of toxin-antitoxin system
VKLIVDTYAALWLLAEDDRLSMKADQMLTDASNEVLLSAAVVWEVAIKRSLGKLDAPEGFATMLLDAGAEPLPVGIDHAEAVRSLPWHHRDPFDRLLVAQAVLEGAVLLSNDESLHAYEAPIVW